MSQPNGLRARAATIAAVAGLGLAAPVALGYVRHDVVAPPAVTGCDRQPTATDAYPTGRLPATMLYRATSARVFGRLGGSTQVTKSTVHAYLRGGRRVDASDVNEYSCTAPGTRGSVGFRVDHHTFGALLRRRGTLRLTVVMRMVNANGRRTTLRRVATVRPE